MTDPVYERDAVAVRRRVDDELREAREYQVELEGVSRERESERRRLAEACTPAWADAVAPAPMQAPAVEPTSPEAVAAREEAMDRRLAKNWPGRRPEGRRGSGGKWRCRQIHGPAERG